MSRTDQSEPSVRERIAARFERAGIWRNDRVIVAFSGGPDSTLLLSETIAVLGSGRVVAAHANHGLRGNESDGDEAFCLKVAGEWGIALRSERFDTAALARRWGVWIEEAGRRARYAFFEQVRLENGAAFVCTGHTLDDQAETVLFRIAKGTGLRGMRGIPEISERIVRPMLGIRKAEILNVLWRENVAYRTDSSNGDLAYDRNRLRIAVMPELAKINPSVMKTLYDLAAYAAELDGFLDREVSKFLWDADSFSQDAFEALDPVMKKEVLARSYARANGTWVGLSAGMVEEMLRFVGERAGWKSKRFWKLVLSRSKGRVGFAD